MLRLTILVWLAAFSAGCSPLVQGGMALSRGHGEQALGFYQQALAEDPGDLYARRKMGQTLMTLGRFDAAVDTLNQVLAQAPDDWFATFYLGLSLVGKGERERGFEVLAGYRRSRAVWESQYVAEAAARYKKQPDLPFEDLVWSMEEALAEAQVVQERYEHQPDR